MRWWGKEDFELRREGRKKQEPGKAEIYFLF
jgi:hypothetical protein